MADSSTYNGFANRNPPTPLPEGESKDGWTPGPWRYTRSPSGKKAHISGENWSRLARVWTCVEDDESAEGLANARLIAAAPDLAAAVKEFVAHYPVGTNPFLDAAFNAARAALSLAQGDRT